MRYAFYHHHIERRNDIDARGECRIDTISDAAGGGREGEINGIEQPPMPMYLTHITLFLSQKYLCCRTTQPPCTMQHSMAAWTLYASLWRVVSTLTQG